MKNFFIYLKTKIASLVKVLRLLYNFDIKIWSQKDQSFWNLLDKKTFEISLLFRSAQITLVLTLFVCIIDYWVFRKSLDYPKFFEKILGCQLKKIYFNWIFDYLQVIVNIRFVLTSICMGLLVISFLYYSLRFYAVLKDKIIVLKNLKDDTESFYLVLVIFTRASVFLGSTLMYFITLKLAFLFLYRLV